MFRSENGDEVKMNFALAQIMDDFNASLVSAAYYKTLITLMDHYPIIILTAIMSTIL